MAIDEKKLKEELKNQVVEICQAIVPPLVEKVNDPRIEKIQGQLKFLVKALDTTNPVEWYDKIVEETTGKLGEMLSETVGLSPDVAKNLIDAVPRLKAVYDEFKQEWDKKVQKTKGQLIVMKILFTLMGWFSGVSMTLIYLNYVI